MVEKQLYGLFSTQSIVRLLRKFIECFLVEAKEQFGSLLNDKWIGVLHALRTHAVLGYEDGLRLIHEALVVD